MEPYLAFCLYIVGGRLLLVYAITQIHQRHLAFSWPVYFLNIWLLISMDSGQCRLVTETKYSLQHSPYYNPHKISSCHLSSPPALEGQPMDCSCLWWLVFEPNWKLDLHLLIHKLGKLLIMFSDRWGLCTFQVIFMVCKHLLPFQQKGTQLLMLLLGQIRSITKKAHLPW